MPKEPNLQQLAAANEDLRARLEKAEATLREIFSGESDALMVPSVGGAQLFTLKGADQVYRTLIEEMNEGALTLSAEGVILYANHRLAEMLKTPLEKVIGGSIHSWIAADRQSILQSLLKKNGETKRREELVLTASDGTRVPVTISVNRLRRDDAHDFFCLVATDLTEQKRGEAIAAAEKLTRELLAASDQSRRALLSVIEDLKQSQQFVVDNEKHFRALIENAPDGISLLGLDGKMAYASPSTQRILGYAPETVVGIDPKEYTHPDDLEPFLLLLNELRQKPGGSFTTQYRFRHQDGSWRWLESTVSNLLAEPWVNAIVINYRDISERKHAEEALQRMNRALKTLSAGNLALVQATQEDALLLAVTSVIVKEGGYRLAVVDFANDDPQQSMTPLAWAGIEDGQYWAPQLCWSDTENGQLPVARSIRSGTTQVCRDIASEPAFQAWKDAALAHGYTSNIALPLSGGGRVFGGLSIYASEVSAFDEDEVRLLEELANDLAYGIITLRARVEHDRMVHEQLHHVEMVRQGLQDSIKAIADTVEMRDPYTAGHQRRVGQLSIAIGRELELSEDMIQGIGLAASIHDLGKISIPAEILSKPTKLTAIEFMLLKTHAQTGFDILKDIKFPWPIAAMVLQHHERLDGSGYPQALKGEQILLESRILAVADVVEAMASHRPYRAALGIDSALKEIEQGCGITFDAAVVDACVRLFAEKRFVFST